MRVLVDIVIQDVDPQLLDMQRKDLTDIINSGVFQALSLPLQSSLKGVRNMLDDWADSVDNEVLDNDASNHPIR